MATPRVPRFLRPSTFQRVTLHQRDLSLRSRELEARVRGAVKSEIRIKRQKPENGGRGEEEKQILQFIRKAYKMTNEHDSRASAAVRYRRNHGRPLWRWHHRAQRFVRAGMGSG